MKIIQDKGLHDDLFDAIVARNEKYSKGGARYSATELIGPPQISQLKREHEHEIEVLASSMIWSFFGGLAHEAIYTAPLVKRGDSLQEVRLYATVAGEKISGQPDSYNVKTCGLADWKFTSVYAVKGGLKPEWEAQANIYKHLIQEPVKTMDIITVLRDWSKMRSLRDKDYPPIPTVTLPVPIWPEKQTVEYLTERIELHKACEAGKTIPCTADERWATKKVWAVMKKGRKSALKNGLKETKEEAEEMLMPLDTKHYIQKRPGVSKRCQDYCEVSQWCEQYQKIKRETVQDLES